MHRATIMGAVLGSFLPLAGCTMCASPYDDCSPTFDGTGCCDFNERRGSILAPSGYTPAVDEYVDEPVIEEGELQPRPDPYAYRDDAHTPPRRFVR